MFLLTHTNSESLLLLPPSTLPGNYYVTTKAMTPRPPPNYPRKCAPTLTLTTLQTSSRLVEPPHPHSPMLNETNWKYRWYRYIYICIYTYIYIYIYIYTHTHTHTHIYTSIHIRIYMYIHTYIYIYIHAYIYIYTYKYIHTCMHIYMYIYSAYAHPVASVKQMCTLMFTTSV